MNDFTASNGLTIQHKPNGMTGLILLDQDGYNTIEGSDYIAEDEVDAVVEYRQYLSDSRIGRWRWPENRDFVVYPNPDAVFANMFGPGLDAIVLRESDGMTKGYVRAEDEGGDPQPHRADHIRAARAYYDAIADRPWRNAEAGEVWVLTHTEQTEVFFVDTRMGLRFTSPALHGTVSMPIDHPSITAGHRIYPEPSPATDEPESAEDES